MTTWTRPRPCSQLQNIRSNRYAGDLHDTMLLGERSRTREAGDDVAALVDFLRNHPPPPDNFMSIPFEDKEDEGRGRWSKIKDIAKRSKSMPREPQQIRLPDSAVAGMTTDGHRHIAISIPWEAAPFGQDMRSQYPVFTLDRPPEDTPSRKDSVRTYKNEKGVVTVLRPVSEALETTDRPATASKPSRRPRPNSHGHYPPPLPPHKPTSTAGRTVPHDYIGALPTNFDTSLLDDSSAPWHISQHTLRRSLSSRDETQTQRKQHHRLSIQPSIYSTRSLSTASRSRSRNGRSTPSMHVALQYAEPPPKTASPKHEVAYPCPRTPASPRSRKAAVQDKKRRDLEAMRHAKLPDGPGTEKLAVEAAHPQAPTRPAPSPPGESGRGREGTGESTSGPRLTLSNLMVVMDMRPMPETEAKPPAQRAQETRGWDGSVPELEERLASLMAVDTRLQQHSVPLMALDTQKLQARKQKDLPDLPVPSMTVNKPSPLTPPTSAHGSPPQKHSTSNQISLPQPHEWMTIQEQEQRAREAMFLGKPDAQISTPGDGDLTQEHEAPPTPQADKEVLQVYETFREHRLRDMERRLRRLEQNGDMWLQALVPVLQNMDRRSLDTRPDCLDQNKFVKPLGGHVRDWAPEGGARSTSRVGVPVQSGGLFRSSNVSQCGHGPHGGQREEIAGKGDEDEAWNGGVGGREDASGLDTIEPLMRELAGGGGVWRRNTTRGGCGMVSGR
ncbi:hypothetical protein E4U40_004448 [Claviceps sp. LM458 group G5]|nr:hypothetical protein E4U40_004448 [Claviceps sp. LM458 group G5]